MALGGTRWHSVALTVRSEWPRGSGALGVSHGAETMMMGSESSGQPAAFTSLAHRNASSGVSCRRRSTPPFSASATSHAASSTATAPLHSNASTILPPSSFHRFRSSSPMNALRIGGMCAGGVRGAGSTAINCGFNGAGVFAGADPAVAGPGSGSDVAASTGCTIEEVTASSSACGCGAGGSPNVA